MAMKRIRSSKRSSLRFGVALAASAAVLGFALSLPATSLSGTSGGSEARSLTPAEKKAKAKAIAKCRKIRSDSRRKRCVKNVNARFRPDPKPGKTWQVGIWDNYYSPDSLDVKANDLVNWTWKEENGREAHDVTLMSGPKGVSVYDFMSPTTSIYGTKFKRQLKVPGTYDFICSLHYQMRMQVKVTR